MTDEQVPPDDETASPKADETPSSDAAETASSSDAEEPVSSDTDQTASSFSDAEEAELAASSETDKTVPAAASPTEPSSEVSGNLDVILDLDLPLTVQFGRAEITLGELVGIGPGSVVGLDRGPSDPVEVLVNGKVVARGEVVAVAGNYGVSITDIVSPSDRVADLGG